MTHAQWQQRLTQNFGYPILKVPNKLLQTLNTSLSVFNICEVSLSIGIHALTPPLPGIQYLKSLKSSNKISARKPMSTNQT